MSNFSFFVQIVLQFYILHGSIPSFFTNPSFLSISIRQNIHQKNPLNNTLFSNKSSVLNLGTRLLRFFLKFKQNRRTYSKFERNLRTKFSIILISKRNRKIFEIGLFLKSNKIEFNCKEMEPYYSSQMFFLLLRRCLAALSPSLMTSSQLSFLIHDTIDSWIEDLQTN